MVFYFYAKKNLDWKVDDIVTEFSILVIILSICEEDVNLVNYFFTKFIIRIVILFF